MRSRRGLGTQRLEQLTVKRLMLVQGGLHRRRRGPEFDEFTVHTHTIPNGLKRGAPFTQKMPEHFEWGRRAIVAGA